MVGNLFTPVSDEQAQAAFEAATAGGASFFDTAPYYGHGLSETRLGTFLAQLSDSPVISTKVGRSLAQGEAPGQTGFVDAFQARPYFDYSGPAVERQVGESLNRLGVDRIDMLYVHDLGELTHGDAHRQQFEIAMAGAFPTLATLKAQGITGAIGLGVNEVAICLEVLTEIDIDVILLAGRYTLLEQAPLDDLLPLCEARGVKLIVGGPFNSGVLAGIQHYDYGAVPPAIADKVRAISVICGRYGVPLPAAALQFPLAHPAVVSVIPGARSAVEMSANIGHLAHPVPSGLWAELKDAGLLRSDAPVPA